MGPPTEIQLVSYNPLDTFTNQPFSLRCASGPVRELDTMFLPYSVCADPNWNAEPGEPGYIQNRTHFQYYSYTPVKTSYYISDDDMLSGPGYNYWELPQSNLSAGKLVVDGNSYCFSIDEEFYIYGQPYTVSYYNSKLILKTYSTRNFRSSYIGLYKGHLTGVKQLDAKYLPKASPVSNASDTVTPEQFNALLDALRSAGYLAT